MVKRWLIKLRAFGKKLAIGTVFERTGKPLFSPVERVRFRARLDTYQAEELRRQSTEKIGVKLRFSRKGRKVEKPA